MAGRRSKRGPDTSLPERPGRPGDLKLTKQEAAKRELRTAIRLQVTNGDPVAVHVLVSAASEILTAVGKSKGVVTTRQLFLDRIKPEYQDLMAGALVESFNFMKHGRRDADAVLTFNPDETEMILFFACSDYLQVYKDSSPEINLFLAYKTGKQPELIKAGAEDPFVIVREAACGLAKWQQAGPRCDCAGPGRG